MRNRKQDGRRLFSFFLYRNNWLVTKTISRNVTKILVYVARLAWQKNRDNVDKISHINFCCARGKETIVQKIYFYRIFTQTVAANIDLSEDKNCIFVIFIIDWYVVWQYSCVHNFCFLFGCNVTTRRVAESTKVIFVRRTRMLPWSLSYNFRKIYNFINRLSL